MFEFSKKGPMADTQLTYQTTVGTGHLLLEILRIEAICCCPGI